MRSQIKLRDRLIDEYAKLRRIRKLAEKEGAVETVKCLDEEISCIKLKLQPLELPEIE